MPHNETNQFKNHPPIEMQDIIAQLTEKAGLSPEQATKALQVIKEYIQAQLPPMMQGMVDNFLNEQKKPEDILGE